MNNNRNAILVLLAICLLLTMYSSYLTAYYLNNRRNSEKFYSNAEINDTNMHKYFNNILYREIVSIYPYYKTKNVKYVMVGDSLTYRVNWNELMGSNNVVNRGIDRDTSEGVVGRISSILKLNPEKAFLMIGINDLSRGYSVDHVFSNYKIIIDALRAHSVHPIIESTLYVRNNEKLNKYVDDLNRKLESYCHDNKIEYIDLNTFLSYDHELRKDFTLDGVHLLGNAYEIWAQQIAKYVN